MSPSTTYDQLAEYSHAHRNLEASSSTAKRGVDTSKSDKPDKIPNFSVPKFNGDRLEGATWIADVVRKFKSFGVRKYLTDGLYYSQNDEWSSAFTSRLLDSIVDSGILKYIATELEHEINCARYLGPHHRYSLVL